MVRAARSSHPAVSTRTGAGGAAQNRKTPTATSAISVQRSLRTRVKPGQIGVRPGSDPYCPGFAVLLRVRAEGVRLVRALPGELRLGAPEVTERRRLLVDW